MHINLAKYHLSTNISITSTPPHKHLIYNKLDLFTKSPYSSLTLHFKPISATTSTDLVPYHP